MTESGEAIILRGENESRHIDPGNVYFAFASGRFDYDCIACNAKCCRGYGYSVQGTHELHTQLGMRPAVRFFLYPHDDSAGDVYTIRNFPPSCFFLDANGLCTIHREHGSDAKPETCRLFPFNYIRRVDTHLVVAPHVSLCPLRILSEPASERSNHDQILRVMRTPGVSSRVKSAACVELKPSASIALERAILSLSERHYGAVDYTEFGQDQLTATDAARREAGAAFVPARAGDCESFADILCRVLDVDISVVKTPAPSVVSCVVAATPTLRSHIVFESDWVKPAHIGMSLDRIPRMLFALCALVQVAREAGLRDVTYQTVMRVFSDNVGLLAMLAYLDCEAAWQPTEMLDLSFAGGKDRQSSYIAILRGLLPKEQQKARRIFGDILCENLLLTGIDRLIFLRNLAQRLAARIVPVSMLNGSHAWSRRLRPAVQQWAFGKLPHETMMQLAARQRTRRRTPHTAAQVVVRQP